MDESLPLVHNHSNKSNITINTLIKICFHIFTTAYGLISLVAIGSVLYRSKCNENIQLAILVESLISIIWIIYTSIMIYYKFNHILNLFLNIFLLMISGAIICIGMILVWPYNQNHDCSAVIFQFGFVYFNLWWIFIILALILFGILCLVFRHKITET
jgi:hypothetical protein